MTKLENLLATRGFKEIPEYMWWFNIDARMGFSHDAARDADERWFTEQLSANVNAGSHRTQGHCSILAVALRPE